MFFHDGGWQYLHAPPHEGGSVIAWFGCILAAGFLLVPLREGRLSRPSAACTSDNFYSHPCERGDGLLCARWSRSRIFLLTPLREGRLPVSVSSALMIWNFYSRPCERGDCEDHGRFIQQIAVFLLTPLREGRPQADAKGIGCSVDFYSRPCERGDTLPRVAQTVGRTFLLTPLREGRQDVREAITYPWYFYSRPCERGDRHPRPVRRQRTYFYSRPCERGDDLAAEHLVDVCVISTHAPARGATNYGVAFYDENKFLLTPLREGRPYRTSADTWRRYISTHAPARGATYNAEYDWGDSILISTHAPARGATQRR